MTPSDDHIGMPIPGFDDPQHAAVATAQTDGRQTRLTSAFQRRNAILHVRAERSGIVQDVLKGRVTRGGYALFLRNLHPAYRAMETALDDLRSSALFRDLARPEAYRAAAIATDLTALCGPRWNAALPMLDEARHYAERITEIAQGDGSRLIAHAYTRYLGDLSGGQILKRLLTGSAGLPPQALSFYEFPGIDDLAAFKSIYRDALDRAASQIPQIGPVIEEAAVAFELNIALSEAVQRAEAGSKAAF
jgi:heme oxygenase